MKSLKFREALLVSFKEMKGRRIPFDPQMTVVRGDNGMGKSALIKSLFWAFGADTKQHPKWKAADVRVAVHFSVDEKAYTVVRHGRTIAFFDGERKLLRRCDSVTREVAPYFARLIGFGLRLPDREDALVPLPPAYFFLAFYMDQDASWSNQWSPFLRLGQFANWRKSVIEYHAGIRGNPYYEAKASRLDAEADVRRFETKLAALQQIYESLRDRMDATRFDLNLDAYAQEIEALLVKCERLRSQEERYRAALVELRNQKTELMMQLAIAQHALHEAKADYAYSSSHSPGENIECPTCGAAYDNSFAERFSMATDEDRCAELVLRLRSEADKIEEAIQRTTKTLAPVAEEVERIEHLLARKEGEFQLADILRQKGREELRGIMQHDLAEISAQEGKARNLIAHYERQMQLLDSKERRAEVNGYFRSRMQRHLGSLDVDSIGEDDYASVESTINETGSKLPRALLGYQVAMLDVIGKFGTTAFAPVVLDSPNQQDQDPTNLRRILRFICEHRLPDSQYIVGMVDPMGFAFGGKEVELSRKGSLLLEGDFEDTAAEMRGYIAAMTAALE